MTSKEEIRGILRFPQGLFEIPQKTDYCTPVEETKRERKLLAEAQDIRCEHLSCVYLRNSGLSMVKEIKTRRKRPRDVLEINGIKTEKSGSSLERRKRKSREGGQASPAWAS